MTKNGNRFEGKTTQSLYDMGKDIAEIKLLLKDYEGRLNMLEKWRWILTGGMITLVAVRFPLIIKFFGF